MKRTLETPPLVASEGAKVGAQPLTVGVFGSYGGSAGRPVLLPGLFTAFGSGTRYDARVKSSVDKEYDYLLLIWRDAVRSLSVDAAAYDSVLGALSINATVCDVAYLVSGVGSPFFTPHIGVARVRHWFGEVKGFLQISRLLYRCFPLAPRSTWRRAAICKQKSLTATTLAPSHTQGRFAPRFFTGFCERACVRV